MSNWNRSLNGGWSTTRLIRKRWLMAKLTNFSKSSAFGIRFSFFLFLIYVDFWALVIDRVRFVALLSFTIIFFFSFCLSYRPHGPPCTIVLFTVPYHGKASCTKCLPIDERLTRNLLEESILEEVDSVEESSIAAIAICAFETLVVLSLLVASCMKRFETPRITGAHDTRITPRRNTIYEETISAIR